MKQIDFHRSDELLSAKEEAELRAAHNRIAALEAELLQQEAIIAHKDALLAQLQKALYGQKSEKSHYLQAEGKQLSLFNEAEVEADAKQPEEAGQGIAVAGHQRKMKRSREEMIKNLPVEEVVHCGEELLCAACQTELVLVGKEFVRDEVIYVPARLFVRKHYVEVKKCRSCGMDESQDEALADIACQRFFTGKAPEAMIPRSFCSPELLAHIAYEKYAKGVPLYRMEKDFLALGFGLSRTTMANWIIYSAHQWLKPLWQRMKEELLKQQVIHADETVVQVLKEPGKKAKSDSRMWVYSAGEIGSPSLILFEYQPGRSGEYAKAFLEGYSGYLVCDGYGGYNKVKGVTRCGCWAHVRRKFVEALPSNPQEAETSQAAKGLEKCNALFRLEKKLAEVSPEDRQEKRQELAKPMLDEFFAWLAGMKPSGGTKLAQAAGYALEQKPYLTAYLMSPLVPLSNNRAENAIRPFVVGRKQWLFSDTVKGAQASAMFYSIVATACANGLNIESYLAELFRVLSQNRSPEAIQQMVPIKG